MTTKELRAALSEAIKQYEAASREAITAAAIQIDCALARARAELMPPKVKRATKCRPVDYTPESWTETQRKMHEADSLEEAFYCASCLAGGWYHRAVTIYYIVVNLKERYRILPADAPAPEGYEPTYRVERCEA